MYLALREDGKHKNTNMHIFIKKILILTEIISKKGVNKKHV